MKLISRFITFAVILLSLSSMRIAAYSPSDFMVEFLNQPNPDLIIMMRRPSTQLVSHPLFNQSTHTKVSGFNDIDIINEPFNNEPYIMHLKSSSHEQTLHALSQLSNDHRVLSIEIDVLRQPLMTYNDPGRNNQWYLNALSLSEAHDNLVSFNLPFGGLSNIVVAVIDTGLNRSHPEFINQLWVNPLEIPNDGLDNDNNGVIDDVNGINSDTLTNNFEDSDGHGTHVSGVIVASTNNSVGMVGIAPNVKLMSIKASRFFPNEGKELLPSSAIYNGLMYAFENGAHIVNMSFGSPYYLESEETMLRSLSQHMILVAAAGNESKAISSQAFYPAAYDGVIGVMSYKQTPNLNGTILSDFSNFDDGNHATRNYDIMAPGQYIYSTYLNQGFAYMNGTSMASPTVAGVAALLMTKLGGFSVYDAPTISNLLISQNPEALGKIVNTVEYRYPKLNALNTLKINPVISEVLAFNQYGIFNFTIFGDYFLPGLEVLIDDVPVESITHDSMKQVKFNVELNPQTMVKLTLRHPDNTQVSKDIFVEGDIPVESLEVNPTSLTFSDSTPQSINVTLHPENATNKSLIFTSLNPNVASVNAQGLVTPVSNGTTTIQVQTLDLAITKIVEVSVALTQVNITYRVNDDRFPVKSSISALISGSTTQVSSGSGIAAASNVEFSVSVPAGYIVVSWVVNGTKYETRDTTQEVALTQANNTVVVELVRRGDLNNDGNLSTTDLVQLQRLLAGILNSTLERQLAGDVNESATITTTDLVQLMRILAGIPLTENTVNE
jgi:hypothetical protein